MTAMGERSTGVKGSFSLNVLFGGVSFALTRSFMAPIEIIDHRTRYPGAKGKRLSDILKDIYQEKGIKSFWKQNFTNVRKGFLWQALNLAFNDKLLAFFNHYDPRTEFGKFMFCNLISGGTAGVITLAILFPSYSFKLKKLDLSKPPKPKIIRVLYKGFAVSAFEHFYYRTLYLGGFETLKGTVMTTDSPMITKFLWALVATATANFLHYPIYVVRNHLTLSPYAIEDENTFKGLIDGFAKMMRNEGFGVFFKKNGSYNLFIDHVLRSGAAGALTLVFYNELQLHFAQTFKH